MGLQSRVTRERALYSLPRFSLPDRLGGSYACFGCLQSLMRSTLCWPGTANVLVRSCLRVPRRDAIPDAMDDDQTFQIVLMIVAH